MSGGGDSVCKVCGVKCTLKCSLCQNENYCGRAHQKFDWASHKQKCLPVQLKVNSEFGPHWVASRDIKMGDVIFQEQALLIGPRIGNHNDHYMVCLGCYTSVLSNYRCSGCGWPACDANCEKKAAHAENECKIFSQLKIQPDSSNNKATAHHISVLRCLLVAKSKHNGTKRWNKMKEITLASSSPFYRFQSHLSKYKELENTRLEPIVKFIQETCKLKKEYDRDDVKFADGLIRFYGLHYGNSEFGIISCIYGFKTRAAVVLCEKGSKLAHSCTPNSMHSMAETHSTIMITVHSTSTIKAGDPITITFLETYRGTTMRLTELSMNYYFDCECARCADPTEFGSFFAGIKCKECKNGYLLPKEPLELASAWKCTTNNSKCKEKTVAEFFETYETLRQEFFQVQNSFNTCSLECVDALEELMKKHSGITLHPNHEFLNHLKFHLTQVMFNLSLRPEQESPAALLALCKRAARLVFTCYVTANTILPGWNKYRGQLLYELEHLTIQINMTAAGIPDYEGMCMSAELSAYVGKERKSYEEFVSHLGNFEKLLFKPNHLAISIAIMITAMRPHCIDY